MKWLTQALAESSIAWLLLSTAVALMSGFLSSWLTFRFVKRQEMIETARIKARSEKQERVRQEIVRWANPILASVRELESRLDNILEDDGYLALSQNYATHVNPNWSITYDYFMPSTLFLFGQYFAWVRMLQEELSFELFESQEQEKSFFDAVYKVGKALSSFPPRYLPPGVRCSGQDTQVFILQQRVIGELMTLRDDGRRCMGYPEFLKKLSDPEFKQHLEPLRTLLEELRPDNECRWKRLTAAHQALVELDSSCTQLLKLPQK